MQSCATDGQKQSRGPNQTRCDGSPARWPGWAKNVQRKNSGNSILPGNGKKRCSCATRRQSISLDQRSSTVNLSGVQRACVVLKIKNPQGRQCTILTAPGPGKSQNGGWTRENKAGAPKWTGGPVYKTGRTGVGRQPPCTVATQQNKLTNSPCVGVLRPPALLVPAPSSSSPPRAARKWCSGSWVRTSPGLTRATAGKKLQKFPVKITRA